MGSADPTLVPLVILVPALVKVGGRMTPPYFVEGVSDFLFIENKRENTKDSTGGTHQRVKIYLNGARHGVMLER